MSFKYSWFCELLDQLEAYIYQQRATHAKQEDPAHRLVLKWYDQHAHHLCRNGKSGVALLSALLPERRADRTYNLQEKRLTQIFGRTLGLGMTRLNLLSSWTKQDGVDFASRIEMVMNECEFDRPSLDNEVTLEEIDEALTRIAGNAISSAPEIRSQASRGTAANLLPPIIRRLRSTEAKWFVRMILKSYGPVEIPEDAALYGFHFMLPRLLAIQNSFTAALESLARPELASLPVRPSKTYEALLLPILTKEIMPRLGIMVCRQPLDKARSIKHCAAMAGNRTMSVERKYDGEYCQVHVDLSKDVSDCIRIFSKNGKDSTEDRVAVHGAIKLGLKLGTPVCKIHHRAILEGELVVYSQANKAVLPFYHVRKHVRHGGRFIGTEQDSPKRTGERLMIVFFNVLLLDDYVLVSQSHKARRALLKGLVTPVEGASAIVERQLIDFATPAAPQQLRKAFGSSITMRWEGLVLKGTDDPYVSWKQSTRGIKLKKDYIAGLGDTVDLCIVAGRRDPRFEASIRFDRLLWTNFYVACILNKEQVRRYNEKPVLRIVDCLGLGNLSKPDMHLLNVEGKSQQQGFTLNSEWMVLQHPRRDLPQPTHLFSNPIIVELVGAGYERPQTVDFWVLRFPRKSQPRMKVYRDRGVTEIISFDELQELAEASFQPNNENPSMEDAEWITKLTEADPASHYIVDKSQTTSPPRTPHSATTVNLTPAPSRNAITQIPIVAIRADSEELETADWQQRHPNSAPQTPSRRTESTESLRSTTQTAASKRRLSAMQEIDPNLNMSQKRRRVDFKLTIDIQKQNCASTFPDITHTSAKARNAMSSTKAIASRKPGHPNREFSKNNIIVQKSEKANPSVTNTTTFASSLPSSTNEAPQQTRKISAGYSSHVRTDIGDDSMVQESVLENPSPRLRLDQADCPIMRTSSSDEGTTPVSVLIAPSLASWCNTAVCLHGRVKTITKCPATFVEHLLNHVSRNQRAACFIMLIDSSNIADSVSDLQHLCRVFSRHDNNTRSTLLENKARILVFDFHALDTFSGLRHFGFDDRCGTNRELDRGHTGVCAALEIVDRPSVGVSLRPDWNWDGEVGWLNDRYTRTN